MQSVGFRRTLLALAGALAMLPLAQPASAGMEEALKALQAGDVQLVFDNGRASSASWLILLGVVAFIVVLLLINRNRGAAARATSGAPGRMIDPGRCEQQIDIGKRLGSRGPELDRQSGPEIAAFELGPDHDQMHARRVFGASEQLAQRRADRLGQPLSECHGMGQSHQIPNGSSCCIDQVLGPTKSVRRPLRSSALDRRSGVLRRCS